MPGRRVHLLRLACAGGALDSKQGAHVGKPLSPIRFRRLSPTNSCRLLVAPSTSVNESWPSCLGWGSASSCASNATTNGQANI